MDWRIARTATFAMGAMIASTGGVLAQEANLVERIYAEMDADKVQTFELVSTVADHRIAKSIEDSELEDVTSSTNQQSSPDA